MIREITAKTMLAHVRQLDEEFGLRYNLNLYRGCQHRCIYCDSRSQCYGIENFDGEVLVKANAIELLARELPRKREKGVIGTGSMNDPYMPAEKDLRLTRRALELITAHGFGVHTLTKSDLALRDLDLYQAIGRVWSAVSFTVTTPEDALAAQIEPGAPISSRRFAAMERLATAGVRTGTLLMPVLAWITESEDSLREIIRRTAESGGRYVIAYPGLTLRDRQREYFYAQLDKRFPGLRARYERRYGERYSCPPPDSQRLWAVLREACEQFGVRMGVDVYRPKAKAEQLGFSF
jgi:DNA repair photolyase